MNPKNKYYTTRIWQTCTPDKKEAKENITMRKLIKRGPRENSMRIQ